MVRNKALVELLRKGLAIGLFISGIAKTRAWLLKMKQPLVRVLLVHHVRQLDKFASIIKMISENYHPISLDDFLNKRFDDKKINILFTLDDGYLSWYENAVSVLEKYSVPALFFVSSGFIESGTDAVKLEEFCKERLLLTSAEKPMTSAMLQEVARHPLITVGGHSQTHPFFEQIAPEEVLHEVKEDKNKLEAITGKRIKAFAYPFGRGEYSDEIKAILKEEGYEVAFTTHSDFYRVSSDIYQIPRSNHGTVSPFMLRVWISGAFDIVQKLEKRIRSLLR